MVFPVFPAHRVPEGQVLRIERSFGHDGFKAHDGPADAVRRFQRIQARDRLRAQDNGLVAFVGRAIGIGVLEGRAMSRITPHQSQQLRGQDDVVGLRPLELEQPQSRAPPVDAVVAFGIAQEPRMLLQRLLGRSRVSVLHPPIVHPVQGAVLEDRLVRRGVPLPGSVRPKYDFATHGMVKPESRPQGHGRDEVVVDEKLQSRADVAGRIRRIAGARFGPSDFILSIAGWSPGPFQAQEHRRSGQEGNAQKKQPKPVTVQKSFQGIPLENGP